MTKLEKLSIPLIQGGMGVGISLSNLAGTVAFCGAMGVLSSAYLGVNEKDFESNKRQVTIASIGKEIRKAKKISQGNGLIGINIMCAIRDYEAHVKESLAAGIDAIISGAGLPLKLPSLAKGYDTLLIPIISSARVAKIIIEYWQKKYNRLPDAFVLEGKRAGGHLGYSREELEKIDDRDLFDEFEAVKSMVKTLSLKQEIPIFVAGGITTKNEVDEFISRGARGVQLGTVFAISRESDATEAYKEILLNAKSEDTLLIESPAGLPARAIKSPFLAHLTAPKSCVGCLKSCKGMAASFCLSEALVNAVRGDYTRGLFFTGSEIGLFNTSLSVQEIIKNYFGDDLCEH